MSLVLCCVKSSPKHWFVKKQSSTDIKGQALVSLFIRSILKMTLLPNQFLLRTKSNTQYSGLCVNTYNLVSSFDFLKLFYFWKVLHSSQNLYSVHLTLLLFYSFNSILSLLLKNFLYKIPLYVFNFKNTFSQAQIPCIIKHPITCTSILPELCGPSLCLIIAWHLSINHDN